MIHWEGIYLLNCDNSKWKEIKAAEEKWIAKQFFIASTGLQAYNNEKRTTEREKQRERKTSQQMDMASCNNCNLKEKEQAYTAARDGNLMYLKVGSRWLLRASFL